MTKNLTQTDHIHVDSAEHTVRVEKVHALRKMGIEPWPAYKPVSATVEQVVQEFSEDQEHAYTVAGRLLAIREHGKSIFAQIQDRTGKVQIYLKSELLAEGSFDLFKHFIDVGDIIWVKAISFRTKTGEITLKVQEWILLSKCLHPLPEKFHGMADVELKYRRRYLDLISDSESRKKFTARSKIISDIRHYLEARDFMEVETPMLHPIAGGAAAKPFVTHHNAYGMDLFLRIAPELYLKRLVIGGFERVFEINRNFRNEGVSTKHNPEFTMLEFYMAHEDYLFAMNMVEDMLRNSIMHVCKTLQIQFGEHHFDFSKPFDRMGIKESILHFGNYDEATIAPNTIDVELKRLGINQKHELSYGQKLFLLFDEVVEHKLIDPTFIVDFPAETSPLAKLDSNKPGYVSRFELFIAGMEIANSYNELNEPFDQEARFKEQELGHAAGDHEAHRFDADYVFALQHGLPPTVGCGIGIDRLVMIITNTCSIKDVILFPTLKRK